jgi:predicted MFS family arabinose efflux permease
MSDFLEKTLKIYDRERRRFLWAVAFFFLIFLFMAIFRSYVDATFLKRYGAEQIPLMLLINGAATVVFFWIIGLAFKRLADSMLVAGFMILSALLTGALFVMVLEGTSLAYPLLYQLLNLQDSFFLVYLWNIAGDLFDARQGKRIFPLIMAGQVLGTTLGSVIVAPLAKIAGYDSLLVIVALAYLLIGLGMMGTAPHFVPQGGRRGKTADPINKKPGEILSLIKENPIIRYLVANAFFPNLLLPVFTYQFAVIVQETFHSEQALLTFLGLFRGSTTLVIFLLMFVMGRLYAKTGLTKASFFHPLNFAMVFTGLAASFNIFIAAYGQFSVMFIQRAIAGPINKVLFNMTPERTVRWSRVFIGGTVLKVSIIISALSMVLLQRFFSPHDLSYFAVAASLLWIYETYLFHRRFASGLTQTLRDQAIDYERIEAEQAVVPDIPYMGVNREFVEGGREDRPADGAPFSDPDRALGLLDAPDEIVRARAAGSFSVHQDVRALNRLIERLNDVGIVRRAAIDSLSCYGEELRPFLEAALIHAPLREKQGILEALRLSGRKSIPFPFIGHELQKMYRNLETIEVLARETASVSIGMLVTHLREDNEDSLRLMFQAMRVGHQEIRLIYESLHTDRAAIAVELLESMLPPDFARFLTPLIDNISLQERIEKGRDLLIFRPSEGIHSTLSLLGGSADRTIRMLTAFVIGEHAPEPFFYPTVERLIHDPEENVRQTAAYAMKKIAKGDTYMPEIITNMDALRKTPLFDGMSVRALEAVGSIVQQKFYKAGDIVIKEHAEVFSLYLIITGTIHLIRRHGEPDQQIIGTLSDGAIFGEVSLFTQHPSREAYVVASDFIEFYIIDHAYIRELMNVYPHIGINMGRFFALQLEGS